MVTLGEQPYQGLSNEEVVQCVRNGETNGTPRNCPEQIGSLMETCWRFDPDNRPNFLSMYLFFFLFSYCLTFKHFSRAYNRLFH